MRTPQCCRGLAPGHLLAGEAGRPKSRTGAPASRVHGDTQQPCPRPLTQDWQRVGRARFPTASCSATRLGTPPSVSASGRQGARCTGQSPAHSLVCAKVWTRGGGQVSSLTYRGLLGLYRPRGHPDTFQGRGQRLWALLGVSATHTQELSWSLLPALRSSAAPPSVRPSSCPPPLGASDAPHISNIDEPPGTQRSAR